MRLSIFLFFITIYSIQANNNPEIKFKTNEIEFVNKLQKTWNSSDISIIIKKNEINSVKKNSLIITVKTNFDIDDEKFFELVRTSSSLLFENIQNTASFKAASIDYINTISNNKRSKNIFESLIRFP